MVIERVKCSANIDALRNTHICAQESVLFMNILRNELILELRTYKIAVRTVFVAQLHRSLPIHITETRWWYAYCTVNPSSILLVVPMPIPTDNSTPIVERGIFFYHVSTKDLAMVPIFPVASPLAVDKVLDIICWPGDSDSLQDSTILITGVEELSGNAVCVLLENRRMHVLGRATQMKVLCHSKHIALLSVHTDTKENAGDMLPDDLYLVHCPRYELTSIISDGLLNQKMVVSQGLFLKQGFLLFTGWQRGHLALTIYSLVTDPAPKLIMCVEMKPTAFTWASQILMFDTYHSMFIIDSTPGSCPTKEARRVDLLSMLVCAIDGASTIQLKHIKAILSLLIRAVTEGLHEAQIDRAASVAVANRLMSHTNNTVDNFNSALAKAQRLEEADVQQRQRILELEEERKEDDARLTQIVQKNQSLEQCAADQLNMIQAYQDTICKLQDLQSTKKERVIYQVQSAMNYVSSLTHELQSLIGEIGDWS